MMNKRDRFQFNEKQNKVYLRVSKAEEEIEDDKDKLIDLINKCYAMINPGKD